ncbi:MAG TPA: hypothetical protein VG942_05985 [Hyphomonadaceae bacterium]|nr:hypothetical protein [Hyphomonadaceae bacterium]
MRYVAALACWLVGSAAFAQAYAPPRAPDGKPDLGGVWTNATNAPLERPDGVPLVISREQSAHFDVQTVNGELRTSLIVDPPDGKLPLRDRASAMAWRERYGVYMLGAPQPDFTAGPDTLPNRDRCLMAANAAAPPMTSQGYNDAYEIVQTPSYVLIAVEMMDDTRIIPLFASAAEAMKAHRPKALARWVGDSVGWWEGDTFVVETENVDQRQGSQSPMPTSPGATWTERFTRISDGELLYQVEVNDPALYTRPWKTESSFRPARRIWEYACHEGNYGMAGILSGQRKVERDGVRKKKPAKR